MVKALKGDPINGYFDLTIKGSKRRFTQQNVAEFVAIIPEVLAQVILSKTEGSATLVPIPNSQVTHLDIAGFRTLYLARGISDHSRGRLTAIPALVFATPQTSARKGGTRNKTHIEGAYRIVQDVRGPVVLVDDVCTTGNHFVAAAWKLEPLNCQVVLACAMGRSTKEQLAKPLELREEELSLERGFSIDC